MKSAHSNGHNEIKLTAFLQVMLTLKLAKKPWNKMGKKLKWKGKKKIFHESVFVLFDECFAVCVFTANLDTKGKRIRSCLVYSTFLVCWLANHKNSRPRWEFILTCDFSLPLCFIWKCALLKWSYTLETKKSKRNGFKLPCLLSSWCWYCRDCLPVQDRECDNTLVYSMQMTKITSVCWYMECQYDPTCLYIS